MKDSPVYVSQNIRRRDIKEEYTNRPAESRAEIVAVGLIACRGQFSTITVRPSAAFESDGLCAPREVRQAREAAQEDVAAA